MAVAKFASLPGYADCDAVDHFLQAKRLVSGWGARSMMKKSASSKVSNSLFPARSNNLNLLVLNYYNFNSGMESDNRYFPSVN